MPYQELQNSDAKNAVTKSKKYRDSEMILNNIYSFNPSFISWGSKEGYGIDWLLS